MHTPKGVIQTLINQPSAPPPGPPFPPCPFACAPPGNEPVTTFSASYPSSRFALPLQIPLLSAILVDLLVSARLFLHPPARFGHNTSIFSVFPLATPAPPCTPQTAVFCSSFPDPHLLIRSTSSFLPWATLSLAFFHLHFRSTRSTPILSPSSIHYFPVPPLPPLAVLLTWPPFRCKTA